MKSQFIYTILCAGVLLSTGSCSQKFLETEPNGLFTPEQLSEASQWNPDILRGQASGIIATTFTTSAGGIGGHSDFGTKGIDIQTDLMSSDMEMRIPKFGHFSNAEDLSAGLSTSSAYSYANWRFLYKLIFAANAVFDTNGSDEKAPDKSDPGQEKNANYFGQSKVLRGYAYYTLARLFCSDYATDKGKPCAPIYRTASNDKPLAPASIEEVLKFACKDIKEGYEILKGMPHDANKDNVNDDVALGLLAYANLQSANWQGAYDAATALIETGKYPLMTAREVIESGFNSWKNPEFIWCIDLTKENTGHLVTFWGHMDIFTMSYAAAGDLKRINPHLYESIPKEDVRTNWFMNNPKSPFHLAPYNKFFDSGREIQGDRSWTNDEVYLRIAEMYLIAAESAARMDKLEEAKKYLSMLLENRFNFKLLVKEEGAEPNAEELKEAIAKFVQPIKEMSKEQLMDAILYNWRIEMWGEGRALSTKQRFHVDMQRSTNAGTFPGQTIKWNDDRLVFHFPEREIVNNPELKR